MIHGYENKQGVGFEVGQAVNGKEAVEEFESFRPHAVMMDIRMPVMDGIEATRRIRALEKEGNFQNPSLVLPKTVIIAVSASAMEHQVKEIRRNGLADDFIGKPFKEEEIFGALRNHLGIRYICEESDSEEEKKPVGSGVDQAAEAILHLPETLVTQLGEAVVRLDIDRLRNLNQEVKSHDRAIADTIDQLMERFDFDSLGKLLGESD